MNLNVLLQARIKELEQLLVAVKPPLKHPQQLKTPQPMKKPQPLKNPPAMKKPQPLKNPPAMKVPPKPLKVP